MSAASPTSTPAPAGPAPSFADRLIAAVPLAFGFLALVFLYLWQAHNHATVWLFGDELEMGQLARSVAETGHAARRGVPYDPHPIVNLLLSPAWLFRDVQTSYAVAKGIGVVAMAAVVFPAYGLARMVARPLPALIAAIASGAIPAMAYSAMLVPEPAAYTWSTLTFFLAARALVAVSRAVGSRSGWWRASAWAVAAALAALAAPSVRNQLAATSGAVVLAVLVFVWTSERARRERAKWSVWDWAGAVGLLCLVPVVIAALAGTHSNEWATVAPYQSEMFRFTFWALGALAIGLGILPVVAGVAALFPPREQPRTRELRAFQAIALSAFVTMAVYTAVKSTFLWVTFEPRTSERNLIYLAPILLAGTAMWVDRRRVLLVPLAAAGVLALLLVLETPYEMNLRLYFDAYGLAILQNANRVLSWTPHDARVWLLVLVALSVGIVLLTRWVARRNGRLAGGIAATAALLCVAWSLTGEISASNASNAFASELIAYYPKPYDWADRALGGKGFVYIGQSIDPTPNGIWLLEFWNRNLRQMWSLDQTAPGPGPLTFATVKYPYGTLEPQAPTDYVVTGPGVHIVGETVATRDILGSGGGQWQAIRYSKPLRLAYSQSGISNDGWSTAKDGKTAAASSFDQFEGRKPGTITVSVSRAAWTGRDVPGVVTITMGRAWQDPAGFIHLRPQLAKRTFVIHAGQTQIVRIPAPAPPWRVETTIAPTFVPHQLDPRLGDQRHLAAQVGYSFTPSGG